MAELQPNDEFLVNRNDVTYKQPTETLMAKLENDDYLLINREDVTYKISGEDIIDSLIDPLELDVTLDITDPAPDDTITAIASPSGGKQPYTPITYQWKKRDQASNITDLAGETNSTFLVTADLAAFELACEATVGDSLGNSVTTLSAFTSPVTFKEEVDTPELLTPPDGAGMGLGFNPESGFILSAETEGPTATMHGLRFDSVRKTFLNRGQADGNRRVYTVSFWYKPTNLSSNSRFLDAPGAPGGYPQTSFHLRADGTFRFNNSPDGTSFKNAITENAALILNKWHHIMLVVNLPGAEKCAIYVDGRKLTLTADTLADEDTYINTSALTLAIANTNNTSFLDGYLSDYFFVDGQALPPETFGKDFDGKWGPLDSAVVKSNIETKSPEFIAAFPDADYDSSQVWSAGGDSSNINPVGGPGGGPRDWPLAFNGINELNNCAFADVPASVGKVTATWTGNIPVTGDVEILCDNYPSLTPGSLIINGKDFSSQVPEQGNDGGPVNGFKFFTIDLSGSSSTTSIERIDIVSERNSIGDNGGLKLYGIKVNGKILVDSGFGANGFYLPFDPAATGENYSSLIDNAQFTAGSSASFYNGTLFTGGDTSTYATFPQSTETTVFDGPSTVVTSLRVYSNQRADSVWKVNNSTVTVTGNNATWGWRTVTGFTSPVNKITITETGAAGSISAIEFNGELLVDYNSIGVDDSGNDNHFHDENFAVGNTSQVWRNDCSWTENTNPNQGAYNAFDGSTSTYWYTLTSTEQVFAPAGGIDATKFEVHIAQGINCSAFTVNGSDARNDVIGTDGDWVDLSSYIVDGKINNVSAVRSPGSFGMSAFRVDGKILIDGNIADTVTDTPMRNYAVLTGEAFTLNGALETNTNQKIYNSTVGIPSNSKIYWEVTIKKVRGLESNPIAGVHGIAPDGNRADQAGGAGFYLTSSANNGGIFVDGVKTNTDLVANSGDLIGLAFDYDTRVLQMYKNGVAWDSLTATNIDLSVVKVAEYMNLDGQSAINFGQQPFTASNVTHNQAAGTVEIDGVTYGTLNEPAVVKATLQLADAGTLDSIEGNPTMTAKVGGAKGTYESHTSNELVLTDVSGTWEVASEKAVSDVEYTVAAINPNDFVMTSSAFEALPSETTHGSSTWQVTEVNDYLYANPAINVTSSSALESLTTGGLEEDTVYRARVKHTSTNGVDSLWSEQRHQNVFKTEKLPVTVPDADMNGLRFDSARETHLNRTLEFSDFTLSVWFKKTGSEVSPLAYRRAQDQNGNLFIDNTRILLTDDGMATKKMTWNVSISDNVWNHIVVSKEGGNYDAYLNGEHLSTIVNSGTPIFGEAANYLLGGRELNIGGFSGTDAYFSDFYLVDGHALAPTAFGALFPSDPSEPNRRWGPLDSTVVIDNINNYEPTPDAVPNFDQKWSDGATGNFTTQYPATNIFDGNLDTVGGLEQSRGATGTLTFNDLGTVNKLEIYGEISGQNSNSGNPLPECIVINGVDITAGGANSIWSQAGGNNDKSWVEIPANIIGNTLTTIQTKVQEITPGVNPLNAMTPYLRAIKVNGSILIDGPADQSQVWSEVFTVDKETQSGFDFEKAFNGGIAETGGEDNFAGWLNAAGEVTVTFPAGTTATSKVTVWSGDGLNGGADATLTVDGVPTTISGTGYVTTKNFDVSGEIQTLKLSSGGGGARFYGVAIDGEVLVDGAATWNTSQVWSAGTVTGDPINNPEKTFDGNLNTGGYANGAGDDARSILTFDTPVDITSEVVMRTNGQFGSPGVAANLGIVTTNGTKYSADATVTQIDGKAAATWTVATTGAQLLGLSFAKNTSLTLVSVDGVILVDKGNIGANGFYLPFDPAATGALYSNSLTVSSGNTLGSPSLAFNGSVADYATSIGGSPRELKIGKTFTDVQTLEVYLRKASASNTSSMIVEGTGVTSTTLTDAQTRTWTSIPVTDTTVSDIVIRNSTSDHLASLCAIRINGELIVDHNNIGVDASGQDNHFHDQNFAVGNTDEVWSKLPNVIQTCDGSDGSVKSDPVDTIDGAFDGDLTTAAFTVSNGDGLRLDVSALNLPGSAVVESYNVNSVSTITWYKSDSTEIVSHDPQTWVTLGTVSSLGSWIYATSFGSGQPRKGSISVLRVNGKILVDANIQDTVLDTPMKNYAVLESSSSSMLSNGNLQHSLTSAASSFATISRPIDTGNFYYETTMNSARYASLGMSLQNASRSGESFSGNVWWWSNESKSFRNNNCSVNGSMGELFNGDLVGIAFNNGSGSVFVNGQLKFTFDDINDVIGNNTIFAAYDRASNDSLAYTVNFGQQPFAASNVTHDLDAGTVVIDGVTYDTLYQTWEQYATFGAFFYNERTDEIIQAFTLQRRYGLLGAKPEAGIYDLAVQPNFAVAAYVKEDNVYVPIEDPAPRIAAAEAQAAADVAAAQAETRKYQRMLIRAACGWMLGKAYIAGDIIIYNGHVFRALEDNVATADNDPGDLIGTWEYLGLEEDAAPLAIDGYFPLYETEEAASTAGNGSYHAHTIDGVTYYMPDAGVTIYHGDYTGFDY